MNRTLLCVKYIFLLALLQAGYANAQTYCNSTDVCMYNDYIQSFSTTGGTTNITNNNTGCTGNGYNNYTTMIHSGVPGGTVNYSFTNNPNWSEYYKIWVDWNSDGDFDDLNENPYASSAAIASSATVTGSFTIPTGTATGNKRLRIRCGYADASLTPCLSSLISDGETEDYTIFVGSSACSGIPTAGTTVASSATVTCNTTDTLSLQGNSFGTGLAYQWQYNTTGTWVNFGTNAVTQITPAILQNTQYRCQITCTNAGGGVATSTPVTVNVNSPALNIGNDTSICPGVAYVLTVPYNNATYQWSNGSTTQSVTINAANVYHVKVTFANGCQSSDTIVITPGVVPVNNLATTTNLCDGSTAVLDAGNTGSTFVWAPGGQTSQTISTTTDGAYSVTIKSTTGCKITSNTTIITRPLPIANLGNDTSICDGATIVLNAGNPGYAYLWSNGANTQSINASDSGTYTVTTTSPYNCKITEEEHIAYLPSPRVEGFNFIPQFYAALGQVQFYPLNPTNVETFEWDFGDYSQTSTQQNPVHTFATAGDYDVSVKVFNGCGDFLQHQVINVDNITGVVTIKEQDADVSIFPNPSHDNLTIQNNTPDIHMQEVSVFNTLGALVYRQNADSKSRHQLSVSNFAAGIYSVRVMTNKGFIIRKFEVMK